MKIDLYDDERGFVELVDHMGNDLTIVNSARVSFGKHQDEMDDKDVKLIEYLVKHKHTSTFEHNVVTFRMKVPLFVRSQHHRHRTWSYNEISRRYTDFNIEFYEPRSFRTQHKSNRQASNLDKINPQISTSFGGTYGDRTYGGAASDVLRQYYRDTLRLFDALLDAGVCREQARGVLPQSMYTEYYGTVNLSNLLKFIDLRVHEGAQWEIQQLAKGMLKIAEGLWPIAIGTYLKTKEN